MTYGTKVFKDGQIRGYLTFTCSKKIVRLSDKENKEFQEKISDWQYEYHESRLDKLNKKLK